MPQNLFDSFFAEQEKPQPLSLTALASFISSAIAATRTLRNAWVVAELSDVRGSGGHCYLELVEKNAFGSTTAKVRAVIWRNNLTPLRQKFFAATGRDISSGLKVMVKGDVSYHGLYGLSFNISDIDPSYTLGDLERIRREIIERLTREDIINRNRSLPFPAAPQRIAVISASGAAGFGDFMNQLGSNPYNFAFYPVLFNAVLQGDRTSSSIRNALSKIEMAIDQWDCVVIIRGGGATTDLVSFDDYDLARAVALFPIPVIVGIGHERDRTVLDDIACIRCKTPTAVAAFLIDALKKAMENVESLVARIADHSRKFVEGEKMRVSSIEPRIPHLLHTHISTASSLLNLLATKIPAAAGKHIARENSTLTDYRSRLPYLAESILRNATESLTSFAGELKDQNRAMITRADRNLSNILNLLPFLSRNIINDAVQKNVAMVERIGNASSSCLKETENKISSLSDKVRLLNPDNILARGYSITRLNGHAIEEISEIDDNAEIETTVLNGKFTSIVNKKWKL